MPIADTLFSVSGAGPLLEGFMSIQVVRDWFPAHPARSSADRTVLLVRESDESGERCRLLDFSLKALIAEPLPLERGRCQLPQPGSTHVVTDADGYSVHIYAIKPEGMLHRTASIPGQVSAVLEQSGLVLVRSDAERGSVHRLYAFDGRRFDANEYNGFRNLGCRFYEVLSGEQWLTLRDDGTTTERRYYPFSC